MSLDFTALNNIPLHIAKRDFTEATANEEGNLALSPEKPATGQNTAPQGELVHSHRLDQEKLERERTREMYATYQENIKRAGELRSNILKGLQAGEDPIALLLQAIKCISLMTGDTVIYTQSKADILAIYGWGLGEPEPLQRDLEDAQRRLQSLQRAVNEEGVPELERERLQNAIKAHRELIKSLEGAIARTDPQRSYRDAKDIVEDVLKDLEAQGASYE